ncbi:hypothetical protein C3B60_16700 [Cryobacterium zongtaii]|nr:hypothetical protein C3B60_16700 [Cryobacterium zongtaii]
MIASSGSIPSYADAAIDADQPATPMTQTSPMQTDPARTNPVRTNPVRTNPAPPLRTVLGILMPPP